MNFFMMIPRLKPVFLLLFFISLLGCRERTLDLHMEPHAPRIVLLANWKAGEYISVRLLRSLDPYGKVPEDQTLPDPVIRVRKDGYPVSAEFRDMGQGLHSSNVLLEPAHTYQVLVSHEQYPDAASPALYIPEVDVSGITVKRTRNVQGPLFTASQDLYEIDVSQLELSTQYCYTVSFQVFFSNGTRADVWPADDVTSLNDKACYAADKVVQEGLEHHYWLVSPACLSDNREKLKFYIGTSDNIMLEGVLAPIYAERVQLKVGIADAGWLSFAQVNNAQPEGIDLLVMSPKRYKSNITGGYGMVTTLSEAVFEYAD